MCLLCAEIAKESMTVKELARAYHEMDIDPDHWSELLDVLGDRVDTDSIIEALNQIYTKERDTK